ncbi:hypothetical protein CWS02_19025 [Enterobacter sp. EA-1]|nr:hypothetical protein CWS02_19025 [Enterobacter sp. EA-1]
MMVDDVHNQLQNLDRLVDGYFAALAKAQTASDALSAVADKLNTVTSTGENADREEQCFDRQCDLHFAGGHRVRCWLGWRRHG